MAGSGYNPYYSDELVYNYNNEFGPDPQSLNPDTAYSQNFGPSTPALFSNSISPSEYAMANGGYSAVPSSYYSSIGYTPGETYAQYASGVSAADEAAGKAAGVWQGGGGPASYPAINTASPSGASSGGGGRGANTYTIPGEPGVFTWPSPAQTPSLQDLLYGVYGQESSFGTNPAAMSYRPNAYGAFGPYQLTRAAVNSYSPGTNPYTYTGQYQAAGDMMSSLLSRYGGNANMALAGYNWGPNQNPLALNTPSMQPIETQNYVNNAGATAINAAYSGALGNALVRANPSAQPLYSGASANQQYNLMNSGGGGRGQ